MHKVVGLGSDGAQCHGKRPQWNERAHEARQPAHHIPPLRVTSAEFGRVATCATIADNSVVGAMYNYVQLCLKRLASFTDIAAVSTEAVKFKRLFDIR